MENNIITLEDRSKLYDFLYKFADDLWKRYNPCNFQHNKCLRGKGCCHGCKYLTSMGCSTQALWCKLWTCSAVDKTNPDFAAEMEALVATAKHYRLLSPRSSKKDTLTL